MGSYNAAKHYWYKDINHDTPWSPLFGPFPLQPLTAHEGTTTPGVRSICMDGKSVGGGLKFMEHMTIPALKKDVPPSNV